MCADRNLLQKSVFTVDVQTGLPLGPAVIFLLLSNASSVSSVHNGSLGALLSEQVFSIFHVLNISYPCVYFVFITEGTI
jgi:hypothetical protein